MKLWLDLETYCETPIMHGTHRYAEDVEVLLFAYAVDDAVPQVWDVTTGAQMPADLRAALRDADEVWAHNSGFDRTVLRHAMPTICPPVERWRDTMIQAFAHSLPGKLAVLSEILGVTAEETKDKRGKQLVMLFCKPKTFSHKYLRCDFNSPKEFKAAVAGAKAEWCGRASRQTHPKEWAEFISYAGSDILAMRAVHRKMPMWNYAGFELDLWHLDQRINDRGVMTDVPLARAAIEAVDREQARLRAQIDDATLGAVDSATKRQALLDHMLEEHGFMLDDLKGSTIDRQLEIAGLDPAIRELLLIRQKASTSSTSKYAALLKSVSRDGRLRGLLQFNGAARTGRWAGRVWQPQNLPRPTHKQSVIDTAIDDLKNGYADLVHDDVMAITSSCIRGCLVATDDKKMPVADLSNIEGRALAWLAREQWKLDAFAEFDTMQTIDGWVSGGEWARQTRERQETGLLLDRKGEPIHRGHDLYALAYAKSFGVTPEAVMDNKKNGDGSMRQIGKVQELALGYEGGVGAFVTFALVYGIDLDELPPLVFAAADPALVREARGFYHWLMEKKKGKSTYGMLEDTFVACDVIKRGWRLAHPQTASWWKQLEEAFRLAIDNPGDTFEARSVTVTRPCFKSGKPTQWTTITLPSGRRLCYPGARIEQGDSTITYMGSDQRTRKWSRLSTYSGKLAENVTQAFARDVLAYNIPPIEQQGYEIVLSVHDELLTESPISPEYSSDHLAAWMANVPPWAEGLPLAAAGFETFRYRKE